MPCFPPFKHFTYHNNIDLLHLQDISYVCTFELAMWCLINNMYYATIH